MAENYTIDASGEKLGRLASKTAVILAGKNDPSYEREVKPMNKVTIRNAAKINLTDRKLSELTHNRYSGYPGGLKKISSKKIISKKGYGELIRHAVSRMLPKNKHRDTMIKNLTISE